MKKIIVMAMLGILVSAASVAQRSADNDLLALSRRKFQWMIHRNVDSLAMVLDEQLQFIHSTGWIQTRQELINDVRSGKLNYQTIDLSELNVRRYGPSAVVVGRGIFAGTNTGEPFRNDLLFTECYVLRNKQWVLVSRHANKMP